MQIVAVLPSNDIRGEHFVPTAKELHVCDMQAEVEETHAADFILQAT